MSASGDFGPAPPGVDLSETRNGMILGGVITLTIIGTTAVALRVVARMKAKEFKIFVDDYLIIGGLVFSWGTAICSIASIPYGGGKHLQALTFHDFKKVWQLLFAYVMIYATGVTCTKASIIMFYRRIFNLKWSAYMCLFFVIGYWITIIVTINVACRPLSYFWDQYIDPTAKGVCIDVPKFFFGNGIAAMLIDILILCVPIPVIWGLQMPTSKKVAVVGIFLLGSFVCVASIVRIITLEHNVKSNDPTWTISPVFVWSCVEPFIGIVCACLPTFAPFFRRWWSAVRTGRSSGSAGMKDSHQTPKANSTSGLGRKKPGWGRLGPSTTQESKLDHCDEVQLTNKISGPGSTRTKASDEEIGYPMASIAVREDVDVSWDHRNGI